MSHVLKNDSSEAQSNGNLSFRILARSMEGFMGVHEEVHLWSFAN
jgi:hypothetical protein